MSFNLALTVVSQNIPSIRLRGLIQSIHSGEVPCAYEHNTLQAP